MPHCTPQLYCHFSVKKIFLSTSWWLGWLSLSFCMMSSSSFLPLLLLSQSSDVKTVWSLSLPAIFRTSSSSSGSKYNALLWLQSSDTGNFVCTATNKAGRDSKETILMIQGRLSFNNVYKRTLNFLIPSVTSSTSHMSIDGYFTL